MKSVVRRISGRSYVVSKQIAIARMHRGDRPLVVFSMGKTGSTAIARAVQDATGARAFQVFRLVPDRLAEAEARYRADARPPFPGALHLWESEYLLRRPPTPAAPWTVITTVREPVAQAVSAFFHGGGRRGVLDAGSATDELVRTMLDEQWLRPPRRWFDREFAPALGLDVFAQPFDPVLGHAVVETPAVRVLLLRQESFAVAPEVLGKFLGRGGPVPVAVRNEAATKEYAAQYRRFLAAVRLPGPALDQAYSSRYARHFYADSELERFRQRWADGPGAAASSG
jgi:hypothetical protein